VRYLGGKSRIAKHIAAIVNAARTAERPGFWEPFCGGLSMSVQLAAHGPGVISDANPALIALYRAVRDGWDPPTEVTREQRDAALALPDSDPYKAFARIGCGFGGDWGAGYARGDGRNYVRESRCALLRDIPKLTGSTLACMSFFDVEPQPLPIVIYADPPYAVTTGYAATGVFDHDRFWACCAAWESHGVPVFVSEYACPVHHSVLWERTYARSIRKAGERDHTDRLFRVGAGTAALPSPHQVELSADGSIVYDSEA